MRRAVLSVKHYGFTLVELLTVIALTAILAAIAFPAFTGTIARKRVEGTTGELHTDLQFARSEAAQRNAVVTLRSGSGGRCYLVATPSSTCDCTSDATCSAAAIKTVTLAPQLTVSASTAVDFDPVRGTASAATAFLIVDSTTSSYKLQADVTTQGKAKICIPSGSALGGYPSC